MPSSARRAAGASVSENTREGNPSSAASAVDARPAAGQGSAPALSRASRAMSSPVYPVAP